MFTTDILKNKRGYYFAMSGNKEIKRKNKYFYAYRDSKAPKVEGLPKKLIIKVDENNGLATSETSKINPSKVIGFQISREGYVAGGYVLEPINSENLYSVADNDKSGFVWNWINGKLSEINKTLDEV